MTDEHSVCYKLNGVHWQCSHMLSMLSRAHEKTQFNLKASEILADVSCNQLCSCFLCSLTLLLGSTPVAVVASRVVAAAAAAAASPWAVSSAVALASLAASLIA